jgi:hypothetical protein
MATQIAMGPWFIRDESMPYAPGCSYQIIKRKAQTGKLTAESIIRGPGTHQFWMHADKVAGIAHLVGFCHQCGATVQPVMRTCPTCRAHFESPDQRNELGLQYPTEESVHQARIQLEQLKNGQSTTPPPMPPTPPIMPKVTPAPVAPMMPIAPAITHPKVDNTIGMVEPLASAIPLPDSSSLIGAAHPDAPTDEQNPTSTLKTADLNRQAQKLSMTVIAMIVCIVVLIVLIVMLYLGSQKPGGVTGKSPIPRELGTDGGLREETLPKVVNEAKAPAAQLPDPVGSLDLHTVISDARQLEQQGKSEAALAKLQEYARTQSDGKLPFDLETEIKRIEQIIAREKAASFFQSSN